MPRLRSRRNPETLPTVQEGGDLVETAVVANPEEAEMQIAWVPVENREYPTMAEISRQITINGQNMSNALRNLSFNTSAVRQWADELNSTISYTYETNAPTQADVFEALAPTRPRRAPRRNEVPVSELPPPIRREPEEHVPMPLLPIDRVLTPSGNERFGSASGMMDSGGRRVWGEQPGDSIYTRYRATPPTEEELAEMESFQEAWYRMSTYGVNHGYLMLSPHNLHYGDYMPEAGRIGEVYDEIAERAAETLGAPTGSRPAAPILQHRLGDDDDDLIETISFDEF